jgi:uncharacterized membrane protein YeiB
MNAAVLEPVAARQPTRSTSPRAAGERILGYDVARAVALLGMFFSHFAGTFTYDPTRPAWLATFLDYYLTGRQTATFFVLAGIGLTLMSQRAVASGDPRALARARKTFIYRGLFLLALGYLTLAWFVQWDILRVYGVSLLVASCLITASNRRLLLSALAFALGFVVLYFVFDFKENWDWPSWPNLTYLHPWTASGVIRNLFFDGFRSVFPWAAFILFGMWLGRQDLRRVAFNNRALLCAVVVLVIAETTSALGIAYLRDHPEGLDVEAVEALITTRSMPALPLFLLATGGVAVAVIALSIRAVEAWPVRLWGPVAATGQLALTWWVGHLLFMDIALRFRLLPKLSLPVTAGYGVAFFALAVLLSWLWKKAFRQGPLEWLMRKLAG